MAFSTFLRGVSLLPSQSIPLSSIFSSSLSSQVSVGIDGPAGSGKSTVAKMVAKRHNIPYVDTGAMYRCVALFAKRTNLPPQSDELAGLTKKMDLRFDLQNDLSSTLWANGEDVSKELRTPEISLLSSQVATNQKVRATMVEKQRQMAKDGVLMEGRDICTVVMPQAEVKIFITASLEERAKRRMNEYLSKGNKALFEDVKEEIRERDERDESRAHSPLKPAEDSVILNTDGLTIEQVCDKIGEIIEEKKNIKGQQ